jgi:hypothetical protein
MMIRLYLLAVKTALLHVGECAGGMKCMDGIPSSVLGRADGQPVAWITHFGYDYFYNPGLAAGATLHSGQKKFRRETARSPRQQEMRETWESAKPNRRVDQFGQHERF